MRRFLLIVIVAILAVPMLAAAGVWVWLDPAMVKVRLQDAALRATGRVLSIDGPVTLAWGFTPGLRVTGLRLANPPGLSRPDMARVAQVEIRVALLPLLSGRAELRGIRLIGADVLLERDAGGRGNWERPVAPEPPPSTAPATPPSPSRRVDVVLHSATVENATLGWRDRTGVQTAHIPSMTVADGRTVTGTAEMNGIAVAFAGTGPWPLSVRASTPALTVAPGKVLEMPILTIAAAGPNAPVRLEGNATLKGLPATLVVTAASIPAAVQAGRLSTITVSLGEANVALQGFLDIRDREAEFDIKVHVPALATTGAALGLSLPPLQNAELFLHIQRVGAGAVLAGKIGVDGAEAVLDLGFGWPHPEIEGTIEADRIDLDRLLARPIQPVPAPSTAPSPPSTTAATAPNSAVPWGLLDRATGKVRLMVGTLRWRGTDVTGIDAQAMLRRGRLALDPVHGVVGGGPVDIQFEAEAPVQHVSLSVTAPGSSAPAILTLAGLPPAIAGPLELFVALEATGADTAALLQTATGQAGIAMVGGEADLSAIPGLAQAMRGAPVPLPGRTPVRCAALMTRFAAGQAQIGAMLLDSPRLTLSGEGSVGMTDRTLAVRLRPVLALGGASVAVPLQITGPWATPAVKMEAQSGRAQISIGEPGVDACGPALLLARNGRAGPMPTAETPKPPRPADLLRGLLR